MGMMIFVQYESSNITLDVESSDTIEGVKAKIQDQLGIDSNLQKITFNDIILEDNNTLSDYNIQKNALLVLTLLNPAQASKHERQLAKLELAQTKRNAGGDSTKPYYRKLNIYNTALLPTQYAVNSDDTNDVVDNPNVVGLVIGRPWAMSFTLTETVNSSGASIIETNMGPLTIVAKATSFQVNPIETGYILVNGRTIKTTTAGSRGHTLAVITPAGAIVGTVTTYDTFESAPGDSGAAGRSALTSALNSVATGNYIAIVSWDACSFDTTLRTALNTGYGTTLTTTWTSTRYSHIVIAKKLPIMIGSDNPANATESDATAWVLMDGPFYNTRGNPASGFQGGQSWRKMQPATTTNGKTDYIYGDERVYWDGTNWLYINIFSGTISTGTGGNWPWQATWNDSYTAAKITGAYVKTTNYPSVP
jgi:hypothetical protein